MASKDKDSGWSFSDVLDGVVSAGKGAGDIYNSFKGSDASSEEAAYLRGQNAILAQQAEQNRADSTIRIGDAAISTSGLLWVVGGTLGLLAIGLAVKKIM